MKKPFIKSYRQLIPPISYNSSKMLFRGFFYFTVNDIYYLSYGEAKRHARELIDEGKYVIFWGYYLNILGGSYIHEFFHGRIGDRDGDW